MKIQKIITLILLVLISMALFFVFSYTKSSPLTFVLGALICIIVQAVFLCFFCFYKMQQTYRQSHTISLKPNFQLNPAEQFPFENIQAKEQMYFNIYTDEAKYLNQKNQLNGVQLPNNEDYYFDEVEVDQPKQAVISFLKEIQQYYYSLNFFTDLLIKFGQDLSYIEKSSVFKKRAFFFAEFEKNYPPQIPMEELKENQKLVLQSANTNPLQKKGQDKKILFPTWAAVIDLLKFIGGEFHKIEAMRRSNSEMLTMIHKKVLQDFELIETKLVTVGKQLNDTSKNLIDLRKDYVKSQRTDFNINDNNQPHIQMMQWFKKQFYALRDLQRRIKQKQSSIKQKTQQRNYYKQKLNSFREDSQKAFLKTIKTRYIALLDSYHITVDESMRKIKSSFRSYMFTPVPSRPEVKEILVKSNVNQALQAERKYQEEYFKRVDYFVEILDGMVVSMEGMDQFLGNLRSVFGEMVKNLEASLTYKQKMASYFTRFKKILLQRSLTLFNQVSQLVKVNQKMQKLNKNQLKSLRFDITKNVQKASRILSQISINQGPIRHKYQSVRSQIESLYDQIQQKLTKIQQFESLYILHSGRIKKIIVIEFLDFLNKQKQLIAIGNISQNFNTNGYGLIEEVSNSDQSGIKNVLDHTIQNQMEIGSGSLVAENGEISMKYLKFLNQFLFVCFTEWKTSNFFKHQITQELFIAFNKDPNQSFQKIEVSELEFSGQPPQIIWLKQLKTESQLQAFFDIHLAFKGTIKFKLNTIYKLIREIPVEVVIQIQQFYSVMRFCFVPSSVGKGWFSFIGEPISKFKIVPSIGSYRFDIETLRTIFNNFLMNKLKKNTYPIKQKMSIPASKKDEDLAIIENRFKVIKQMETYR